MDETPKQTDKRKLESPGTNSPIYKQSKMADNHGSPEPCSSDTGHNLLDITSRMDKMFEVLNAVKKGQDSLRSTFDSKIEKLRKDVLSTIDDKIKAVKVDVDLQFAAIDRRIDDLENNMRSLSTLDGMGSTSGSFVNQSVSNDELTIIVSNLKEVNNEDPLRVARDLTDALGEDITRNVNVSDACRFSERRRGKPRLMKIAYETVEQKIKVLRAKMALRGHSIYDRVYLRSSKSHTERLLELNAKTILSELPNGHLYRVAANGRILKKDNSRDRRPSTSD